MAITFGSSSAPSQVDINLDSVFTSSLANYNKELIDNIGASNAFLYEILKSNSYSACDGGTYITENAMYGLTPSDSYGPYDELSTLPTDGIGQLQFEWRNQAAPIAYDMGEVFQNKQKLFDLVKARIKQAELGIQEGWAQAFYWGAYPQGGSLKTPRSSLVNGSTNIDPLPKLVAYNSNGVVGNIDSNTSTWWRNHSKASAATTYDAFLYEMEDMYNTVSLGTGGPCDLILCDQRTYQNWLHAYLAVFKTAPDAIGNNYPFLGKKFLNAKVVMDDKVPDAYTDAAGTSIGGVVDPTTLTYGTMYFLNTKFFKVRYEPERNWTMLKDENGKAFAKPINGDSRVGHVAWRGNTTINNRRKQGVLAKIARTLT